MHILSELTNIENSSLALGFFDGLHLGHKVVLKNAINIAKKNNTQATAVIFKEHPLNTLTNQEVPLILTLDEKLNLLREIGIDNVILLDFEKYSFLNATEYLSEVLVKYFSPIAITTGFNHYFGFNKSGDVNFLKNNQEKFGYKYYQIPPIVMNETIISCSTIRNKLMLADFNTANKLLGYNFFVKGIVIEGEKIASKLGFPSANINYPTEKLKIPNGVYYVIVDVDGKQHNGILNYGNAPTINPLTSLKTEVHILDFNQDIYGKEIKISFITKIRNQIKFENKEKLQYQIQKDIAFVEVYKHFLNKTIHFSCKKFFM